MTHPREPPSVGVAHELLHEPQWSGSTVVSTQAGLPPTVQRVRLPGQVPPQEPEHVAVPPSSGTWQVVPHPPQLPGSFVKFTHVFVQRVRGLLQVATQVAPPSEAHAVDPFIGAVGQEAQVPGDEPQGMDPVGQLHPPSQFPPIAHVVPQAPQLLGSLDVLTHVMFDVHSVYIELHENPHAGGLPLHVAVAFVGAVHALHVEPFPQWFGSVVLWHVPLPQSCMPAGHAHAPL